MVNEPPLSAVIRLTWRLHDLYVVVSGLYSHEQTDFVRRKRRGPGGQYREKVMWDTKEVSMILSRYLRRILWAALAAFLMISISPAVHALEGGLEQFTLSNGLDVLIQEDRGRNVSTIQLWVEVGSADETEDERGISHVIEHMAFKGTERRGVGVIASEIEALGGEVNAYTSWDRTVFHVTVPSQATMQGLDILTDAVFNATIDPDELEKEKQVVIEEILEGEERPQRKASKLLLKTTFSKSPYRYPVIGYKETVASFTRQDMVDFRKKWYVAENMFLLVVGNVNPDKVRTEIERLTADLEATGFFRPPRPQDPPQETIRTGLLRDNNARETRLGISFGIPSIKSNDLNALDLAADILGARDSSRLVHVLKKQKKLVNNISAYSITPKNPGLFVISATLDGKNLKAVTRDIMEEIKRLVQNPPSEEELARAKTNIESEHLYSRETVQGLARSLGSFKAEIDDATYEDKYLQLNAAVTPEEVSAVVAKYLAPPNVNVSVLIPENQAPDFAIDELKTILAGYEREVRAPVAQEESLKPIVTTLDNGIRVVLLPDRANPVVSFRIASLGGKRFESETTQGIMNFIAQMLTTGAGNMDELEIARMVEDMGGRIRGFSGYDSMGTSMSFFSRYLDQGLELLAEIYKNPSFPQHAMSREANLIINRIKTEPDRPAAFAVMKLNKEVFPHHPYGFNKEGTVETVAGFTRQDLIDTYHRYVTTTNTVITGVGDFVPSKALQVIERLFGSIPQKQMEPPAIPVETRIAERRSEIIRIPRAKAHLTIGFHGVSLRDEDRYPLEVLNNVLAGMGGRLFTELRDKQSLAYIVTSFLRPGMDPGIMAFYMATDPSNVEDAQKGLFGEIERVRTKQVSDEELDRSISNLIGNYEIALQSTWARAENAGLNTLYGLGHDFKKEYIEKISAVQADDVLRVAQKYLRPEHCAVVKVLPDQES